MSASASQIYAAPPPRAPRADGTSAPSTDERQQQRAELKSLALSVEMFGASKLEGLAKKDQKARERERLGLAPITDHKRPYKQLMALRKKQRAQDGAAATLAKQAGMTARKQSDELARRSSLGSGGRGGGGRGDGPSDGVGLGGGVLHVSKKLIRNVRFHSNKAQNTSAGGRGKGKGSGRGRGASKGRGGRR